MEGSDITADTLQKSAANSSIKQWGGFKTAGNTPIRPPSSNAILQARQRMQDVDSTSITPANKPSALSGFKTAGGRNMPSPSAVALKRAYSMWNDDNATTTTSNTSLVDVKRNRIAEPESPPIVSSSSSNDTSEPLAPTTPKQPLSFQTASALINGSNSNNNSNNSGRLFSRSLSSNLRSPFKSPLRHRSMNSPSKMKQQQQHKDKNENDDLKSSQLCTPSIATRKTTLFDLATKSTNRKCMRDYFGCMPRRHSVSHLSNMNVPDVVIRMTWSNAIDYTFNTILHGQSMAWGAEAAYKALLDYGADKTRVSLEWVRHHYQLIVWKAACIYRSYPEEHGVWSVNWILKQLRYRYEREINKRETPAIRMILEEFELPLLPLVLCVIDMPQRGILRLTDGWYILNAQLDKPLEALYIKEQLKPGDKIIIGSIQIIGHPNEIAALTSNPVAIIALSINSVRRARWDTRLGFVRHSIPMTCISSINPAGGMISAVDVVVIRKLPRLLMETDSNGRKLFTPLHLLQSHNEETWLLDHPNLAHICEPAFESSRSLDEMAEQQASTLWTTLMQMDCMIEYCDNQASNTMKNLAIYLQQYPDKHKQLLVKIKEQIQTDRQRQRRVVLFRVLVRDVTIDADDSITDSTSGIACITIWSPPEQLYDEIQLGKRYQILHLSPSSTSNGQYQHASTRYDGVLQLQANRRSHWRERSLPMDSEHINDWLPTVKCLSSLSNYTSYKTEWSDIVFVVLCTSHKITKQQGNRNTTTPLVIIGDDSNRMALLHLEPNTIRLNSFKDGHVYTLCNLQSIDYDARFKMPVIRTSENSELFGQHHTPSYARSKLQQLLQWKQQQMEDYQDMEDTAVLTMTTVLSSV